jgi:hypothetical protein
VGFAFLKSDGGVMNPLRARDLARVVVEERIRVSEDDPSSYNRFWDGFQEVRTALLRVSRFFGVINDAPASAQTYSSPTPPPSDTYR